MTDESLHVAVVDIGSLTNLGWAVEGPSVNDSGPDIDLCIEALAGALSKGPLALGFEAPMFVPYGRKRCDLDKARKGDGDRSFSASAGACVLTKALVTVPYILQGLRSRANSARPTFNWRKRLSKRDLLLFEAFVVHVGESVNHVSCARLALQQFPKEWEKRALLESAIDEPCTMNLLGVMLLRMGWTKDVKMLSEPCLVIRAGKALGRGALSGVKEPVL
jgi:hypothetical protein